MIETRTRTPNHVRVQPLDQVPGLVVRTHTRPSFCAEEGAFLKVRGRTLRHRLTRLGRGYGSFSSSLTKCVVTSGCDVVRYVYFGSYPHDRRFLEVVSGCRRRVWVVSRTLVMSKQLTFFLSYLPERKPRYSQNFIKFLV